MRRMALTTMDMLMCRNVMQMYDDMDSFRVC